MIKQKKQRIFTALATSAATIIIAALISRVVFSTPATQPQEEQQPNTQEATSQTDHEHITSVPPAKDKKESVKTTEDSTQKDKELTVDHKMSLRDVIKTARTWGPIYTSWFGKKAPNFTLKDINGKEHKLSDYKGKDVMVIFWATWCGPCIMETPHLIALRNIVSKDKLAMLAISNENPILVKQFVADRKINYTVLTAGTDDMPEPYSLVRGIPCSFFVDSEGKIKLATEGLLSLGDIKAILQAK